MLKRHTELGKLPFITDGAKKILTSYDWPGNVRELENVLKSNRIMMTKLLMKVILWLMLQNNNLYKNFDENIKQAVL